MKSIVERQLIIDWFTKEDVEFLNALVINLWAAADRASTKESNDELGDAGNHVSSIARVVELYIEKEEQIDANTDQVDH